MPTPAWPEYVDTNGAWEVVYQEVKELQGAGRLPRDTDLYHPRMADVRYRLGKNFKDSTKYYSEVEALGYLCKLIELDNIGATFVAWELIKLTALSVDDTSLAHKASSEATRLLNKMDAQRQQERR